MTSVDQLDPIFVKALKLLHSKAKDSTAQLKALLDDAIAQRKGLKVPAQSGDAGKSSPGRSKSDDDTKKKEAEKRSSDKSSKDSSESDAKKAKLDSKSRSKDDREAREKEKEKERAKRDKEKKEKEEREAQKQKERAEKERKEKELANSKAETEVTLMSDEEEQPSQMDAGDFALEMGIACVVCRQFDVSSGNQLVECQECHSLYHQECHKPPVTEEDVSDPRFVWYCSRCTKSLKKMVTQKPTKPKPSVPTTTAGKEFSISSSKTIKTEANSTSTSQAFRRIDPKPIVAPPVETNNVTSTTSKPMVGLAGLAANLAKPRGESKSGSSRKSEGKGDGSKSSSKSEGKSSSGNKSDSSSKSTSSSSSKTESSKSSREDKEKKSDSSSKSSSKSDDKKSGDSTSKSSSSQPSGKEEKKSEKSDSSSKSDKKSEVGKSPSPSSQSSTKEDKKSDKSESGSKSEKKSEVGKSPSHSGLAKLEVPSPKSSPPQAGTPTTPVTPDSPSSSKSSSSASNKQAVANLSMVTANKRIQMMKKKAQTKPGNDKKVHIK